MNRTIERLKLAFLVIFAVCCVAIWTAHLMFIWPGQRCEAKGMWWDWRERTCALPVPLQVFTGRSPDQIEAIVPAPQPIAPRAD
jgi:hypothetical protein